MSAEVMGVVVITISVVAFIALLNGDGEAMEYDDKVVARLQEQEYVLETAEIRIRDPFIYADAKGETYWLYAQSGNRKDSGFVGVEAYASRNLRRWSEPRPVLVLPGDMGIQSVWAPEMHAYRGRYYLFVTLTLADKLPTEKPVKSESWPPMHMRGTYVFHADSPVGPFEPFGPGPHTPADWMALDGTLYVEGDTPYMVFCHEWVQMVDGTMDCVQLRKDLSNPIGKPDLLFKASEAPGARSDPDTGKVTDGCFLYRSPRSDRLFMIWSTFIPGSGYCVLSTHSESGRVAGPWVNQEPIYTQNGGHGMIFRNFEGHLLLSLHQPNGGGKERLHLFELKDNGDALVVEKEWAP